VVKLSVFALLAANLIHTQAAMAQSSSVSVASANSSIDLSLSPQHELLLGLMMFLPTMSILDLKKLRMQGSLVLYNCCSDKGAWRLLAQAEVVEAVQVFF
jgi:hypothetical protein